VEAEFRREAEVVRQVRESDLEYPSTMSSPNLAADNLDDIPEDAMMMDSGPGLGLSASFKQQALKNSKGKDFWDTFSETSGNGGRRGPPRITPPPPLFGLPRGSSAGLSVDDLNMDSPSNASSNGTRDPTNPFAVPGPVTASSSSGNDTPGQQQQGAVIATSTNNNTATGTGYVTASSGMPPSAAEITRRINSKRRRDDDLDPVSFKRRAVSPGMSVHNSPIMQSPLQRDAAPWGSRPGSVGGDTTGKSGAPSETGSQGSRKARVGYQGMVDTNDGITKLSIE